jgi:hypothetical protein
MRLIRSVVLGCALFGLACGGGGGAPKEAAIAADVKADTGFIEDLVGKDISLYVEVSPRRIAEDPLWGGLAARAQSEMMERRSGPIDMAVVAPFLQAERVVLAMKRKEPLDAMVIVAGVPADFDPAKMTFKGQPVWADVKRGAQGTSELIPTEPPSEGPVAVVMLPDRSLVVGFGESSSGRVKALLDKTTPRLSTDGGGLLAKVRVKGELVEMARSSGNQALGPIVESLDAVTVGVQQSKDAKFNVALQYAGAAQAEKASSRLQALLEMFFAMKAPDLEWKKLITFHQEQALLSADVTLPKAMLDKIAEGIAEKRVAREPPAAAAPEPSPPDGAAPDVRRAKKKKR